MRLKRYLDFVKESAGEAPQLWAKKEEDFRFYLTEFTDNGYEIDFRKVFCEEFTVNVGNWSRPNYKTVDRLTDIMMFDGVHPAYVITIKEAEGAGGGDISEALAFARDVIESEMEMHCKVMKDEDGSLSEFEAVDPEDVKVVDGEIFVKEVAYDSISIACWHKELVKVTGEQVFEYYGWDKDAVCADGRPKYDMSGIWVRIDQEDLEYVVDWRASELGSSSVINGIEPDYGWGELIDVDSLVRYNLNSEAMSALLDFLIAEAGGLDAMLDEVHTDLDLEGLTDEDKKSKILGERFERTLVRAAEEFGGDTLDEIRRVYEDWCKQDEADKLNESAQDAFDSILGDSFEFVKDEERTYFKGSNGKSYDLYFYKLLLTDGLLTDLANDGYDRGDIANLGADGIHHEWFSRNGNSQKLYVREAYGHVDTDEFSKEIISQYLS